MPELPEVETVARGLQQALAGRVIVDVAVHWQRTVASLEAGAFRTRLIGRRVVSVSRRGKYVVVALDREYLLIHLKMSGRLQVVSRGDPVDRHTHVLFDLEDGGQLRFQDTRKFGRMYLVPDPLEVTANLGPEPLADDFSLIDFRRLLARRSGRLKSLLMNQQFLAGLGNIYADEALFAAGIHPLRKANTLTAMEQARLYESIRLVLGRAVAGRGTTLDDQGYVDAQGQAGEYQEQIAVYGRKGEPCPCCGSPVERLVIGGRSAHFCPQCQPPPA